MVGREVVDVGGASSVGAGSGNRGRGEQRLWPRRAATRGATCVAAASVTAASAEPGRSQPGHGDQQPAARASASGWRAPARPSPGASVAGPARAPVREVA